MNTAIAKIREALGDNAETPAFIETLPKRGYRFVATVSPGANDSQLRSVSIPPHTPEPQFQPAFQPAFRRWRLAIGLSFVAASALAAFFASSALDRVTIAVVRFHNETGIPGNDLLAGTLTDAVVVGLADNPRYDVIGNSPLLVTDRIFQDVRKIGEALNADFVLLGQLQTGDGGLLTRAHLIRSSDQKHVWAGTIDLPATDIERVLTSAVSNGIATGLGRSQ